MGDGTGLSTKLVRLRTANLCRKIFIWLVVLACVVGAFATVRYAYLRLPSVAIAVAPVDFAYGAALLCSGTRNAFAYRSR